MGFKNGDQVIYIYNKPQEPNKKLKRGYIGKIIDVGGSGRYGVKWESGLFWYVPRWEIRLAKPEELS
jgi:hypothetical protein